MLPAVSDPTAGRLLGAGGVRYSRARRAVLACLAAAGRPLSAEDLRGRSSLPYSSVYRTLNVLEEAGILRRLVGADGVARFELDERISGEHHHHLVCSRCGIMDSIVLSAVIERGLAHAALEAERDGFHVDTHRVELVGTCARCRMSEESCK